MAIIVGDIHGNVEKVKAFLAYKPEIQHIALGDYVDSFIEPQKRQIEVLKLLLESASVLLWGNHDLHYLEEPPFKCTGFQENSWELTNIFESHKKRFLAAYDVDGWLCTHAGVHEGLTKGISDVGVLAAEFNRELNKFIQYPYPMREGIWAVGKERGGFSGPGGIFWFDFKREVGIDLAIKQVFGHTEVPEPVVNDHYVPESYVALDTTNNRRYCWLYDTAESELVKLDLPRLYQYPRIRDLPLEEQEPFKEALFGSTAPYVEGVPHEEQDFFYMWDYNNWKVRSKIKT